MKKTAIALTMSLTLGISAAAQASGPCPDTLRFADTGIEGMEEMVRTFGPFGEALGEAVGSKIEFFPVSDRTAAVNALQFDQVDIILAGPSEYAVMRARQDVQLMVGLERAEYGTTFVVHADSDIHSLEDLRGRDIALKDPGSTTGHIVPSWMLVNAGLDIDRDVNAHLLDGARFEALINRDVDAMGSGVRDVARLKERDPNGDYRVIAESDTMPRDAFVARGSLDQACVAHVNEQIMADAENLMEAILGPGRRDKYTNARFVNDLTEEEFDLITEAYDIVGIRLN